jgi:hypothetical protein
MDFEVPAIVRKRRVRTLERSDICPAIVSNYSAIAIFSQNPQSLQTTTGALFFSRTVKYRKRAATTSANLMKAMTKTE